jgi:hypothetical protein
VALLTLSSVLSKPAALALSTALSCQLSAMVVYSSGLMSLAMRSAWRSYRSNRLSGMAMSTAGSRRQK